MVGLSAGKNKCLNLTRVLSSKVSGLIVLCNKVGLNIFNEDLLHSSNMKILPVKARCASQSSRQQEPGQYGSCCSV